METIENFNTFINKKNLSINKKILKKQNKIKKLKQSGGDPSDFAKVQIDLAYLQQLKDIIQKKN